MRFLLALTIILTTSITNANLCYFSKNFINSSTDSSFFDYKAGYFQEGYVELKNTFLLPEYYSELQLVFVEAEHKPDGINKKTFRLILDDRTIISGHYIDNKITAFDLQQSIKTKKEDNLIQETLEIRLDNFTYDLIKEYNTETQTFELKLYNKTTEKMRSLFSGEIPIELALIQGLPVNAQHVSNTPQANEYTPNVAQQVAAFQTNAYLDEYRIPLINSAVVIDGHNSRTGQIFNMHVGSKKIMTSMDGSKIGPCYKRNGNGGGNTYGLFISGYFEKGNEISAIFKTNNGVFILFKDTLVVLNNTLRDDIYPEHTDSPEHLRNRLEAISYKPKQVNVSTELQEFCKNTHKFEKAEWEHFLWLVEEASKS
jgi:hypothetical protein